MPSMITNYIYLRDKQIKFQIIYNLKIQVHQFKLKILKFKIDKMGKPQKQIEMKLLNKQSSQGNKESSSTSKPTRPPVPFPESLFSRAMPIPQKRVLYLDGNIYPPTLNQPNILENSKYTVMSFFPLVLFHQFRYFFNLFFLLIAVSQIFPMLRVGFLFTYVAPLILVLGFTLIKQFYDDFNRKKRDKQNNQQAYTLLTKSGRKDIMSKNIKVGNIIEIKANQRIPCDCVILSTAEDDGSVFIRTDQLDGETDWKLRKSIKFTHNFITKNDYATLLNLLATVNAEQPILDIYKFEGFFKVEANSQQQGSRQGLNLQNTLWGNCFLANSKAVGIVVYTGRQMRSVMNTSMARTKMGKTDGEINYLSKILFTLMCILALIIVLAGGFSQYWLLDLFRQVLLLASIIPISLRVNLDASKLVFSYKINHDKQIQGAIARNSQIPEQLGRIQYILSDKTGTLTQNDMVFKKLSINDVGSFFAHQERLLAKIVKKNFEQSNGPMADIEEKIKNAELIGKKFKYFKRDKHFIVRDFITCLAVCHNVTPSIENDVKTYQASSPDEIALVKIAESLGLQLIERSVKSMTIKNPLEKTEKFIILQNFPFTSASKRMGIILRHEATNRIVFYLKGADSVMVNKVPQPLRGFILDECQDLSRQGLRTLVMTQKYLTEKQYQSFKSQYEQAGSSMMNRDAQTQKVLQKLENDMQLMGITGVEDKLQQDIQQCLTQLRNARINIWMITGDKVQTAVCIGISAGLKAPTQDLFIIKQQSDPYILKNKLNQFSMKTNTVLVIDGSSLVTALHQYPQFFYAVSTEAPAVICCRVSPTQKAVITKGVKQYTGKIVLGIGDGGNDVGMIQMADIGVGIVGKQGKQAALASDFSILKFKHLSKLLLWHGRLSYKNTATMAQFVIHRGLIISVIQCIFSLIFYSIAIPIYNGYLMLGYTTVYTMLPVLCIIFDEDISEEKSLSYPQLYQTLQKGRQLSLKTFLQWLWKSIYQGSIIMLLNFWLFDDSVVQVVTVTFSSLILIQLLNINTSLNGKITCIIFMSQVVTGLVYVLSIIFLREYINVDSILKIDFLRKVGTIVLVAWGPMWVMRNVRRYFDPSQSQKIMRDVKAK